MQTLKNDFSRYFGPKQKVFLINVSENRNVDAIESLSGIVITCTGNSVKLNVSHSFEKVMSDAAAKSATYKLTSEYLGCGLQVLADVAKVEPGNVVTISLHGDLELFQQRIAPRIETAIKIYTLQRDFSLAFYQKEWSRVVSHMKTNGVPANLVLRETPVNLSISGLRLASEAQTVVNPLTMFFLDIDDGLLPISTIAEMVWDRRESSEIVCAHRFIQIRKEDQSRLNNFVSGGLRRQGIKIKNLKISPHLLDRIPFDLPNFNS